MGSNLSQNMVNVAYAQIGKTGVDLNYTENWCADFVSDCAELSGYGSAVPRNANCTNLCRSCQAILYCLLADEDMGCLIRRRL